MTNARSHLIPLIAAAAMTIAACASNPPDGPGSNVASYKGKSQKWTVPTEEEVAAALENNEKMTEAAKEFVKLKKDGELMFCKRIREIGSNIPTLKCLTTAQLRTRVENMEQYRDDMRNRMGKCVMGKGLGQGCRSGNE